MTITYEQPRPLAQSDAISQFECRSSEQTDWIRHHARSASASGTAKVQVITPVGSNEVVAYYAWCMAGIPKDKLLDRWRQGAGRYDQPVALLARLGTSKHHERRGLGSEMLRDAHGSVWRNQTFPIRAGRVPAAEGHTPPDLGVWQLSSNPYSPGLGWNVARKCVGGEGLRPRSRRWDIAAAPAGDGCRGVAS